MSTTAGNLNGWAKADAPYPACCPTGWQCARKDSVFWQCMPSKALDTCTGYKTIALAQPCGGTKMCSKDAICGDCCVQNAFCLRSSSATWTCQSLTEFKTPASYASSAAAAAARQATAAAVKRPPPAKPK